MGTGLSSTVAQRVISTARIAKRTTDLRLCELSLISTMCRATMATSINKTHISEINGFFTLHEDAKLRGANCTFGKNIVTHFCVHIYLSHYYIHFTCFQERTEERP